MNSNHKTETTVMSKALQERDVNQVLLWGCKPAEAEIKRAFERTLTVRELGGKAMELADQDFFETLARVHRTGEGAPFTGLKPAGTPLALAVKEADHALEIGSVEMLVKLVTDEAAVRLRQHFAEARAKAPMPVTMWKRVVNVEYVHYAEGLHQAAPGTGSHSGEGHEAAPAHDVPQAKHNH